MDIEYSEVNRNEEKPNQKEKKKLLAITYESNESNIEICLKTSNGEFFKLEKFSIPDILENTKKNFKNEFIFFLKFCDHEINFLKYIFYQYTPGILGEYVYETNERQVDSNLLFEFITDLKFNKNDKYKMYKEPNGKSIESKAKNIILSLTFLLANNKDDLFVALSNFLYASKKILSDWTKDEFNLFNDFLNELYVDGKKISNKYEIYYMNLVYYLCCLYGLIDISEYKYINVSLCVQEVHGFLTDRYSTTKKVKQDEILNEFFNNGLRLLLYKCISNGNFKFFIDLSNEIIKYNLNFEEKINQLVEKDLFIIEESFENLKTEDLNKIPENRNIIIDSLFLLTDDLDNFFALVEKLKNENGFKESLNKNWDKINHRLFNLKNKNENAIETIFNKFCLNKEFLNDNQNLEFFIFFITAFTKCLNIMKVLEMIEPVHYENKEFHEKLIKNAAFFLSNFQDLKSFFSVVEKLNLEEDTNDNNHLKNKIKKRLYEIQPPFRDDDLLNILTHSVKSKVLFKNGFKDWKDYFNRKFIEKLHDNNHILIIIRKILVENFDDCIEWKEIFIKIIFRLDFKTELGFLSSVANIFNKDLEKIDSKHEELFRKFIENFFIKGQKKIENILNLIKCKKLFQNDFYFDVYMKFIEENIGNDKQNILDLINKTIDLKDKCQLNEKFINALLKQTSFEENENKIKQEIIKNPSRLNNFFNLFKSSNYFQSIKNSEYITHATRVFSSAFKSIFTEKKLNVEQIEDLKKLDDI